MNVWHSLAIVGVTAVFTLLTRALPFLVFTRKRGVPRAVAYLGRVLPAAVMAALVVYCLKGVSFTAWERWVVEVVAVAVTSLVHLWRRNTLLSIGIGTLTYMVLVQRLFW